jgi:hypothetical protein
MLRLSKRIAYYRPRFPDYALYTIPQKLDSFADLGFGSLEQLFHHRAIDIVIAGVGLAVVIAALLRRQREGGIGLVGFTMLLWTAAVGVGISAWSPLAWDRYYIPWTPVASLWEGIGAAWLFLVPCKKLLCRVHGQFQSLKADTRPHSLHLGG